jgi:CTP:molybdopterin cytidylyltransferase MocA
MIASLQTGLRELENYPIDAFLFQPVDLPLITPDDLETVMQAFARDDSGALVFAPTCEGGRGHPVLCSATLAEDFLALGPAQTARDIIGRHDVVSVETGNPGVLLDMDAPDEYRQLKTIYMSRQE